MGEALFDLVLAELRGQGSEGPPHRIPDLFFVFTRNRGGAGTPRAEPINQPILFGSSRDKSLARPRKPPQKAYELFDSV
jgi:hypothetical protein